MTNSRPRPRPRPSAPPVDPPPPPVVAPPAAGPPPAEPARAPAPPPPGPAGEYSETLIVPAQIVLGAVIAIVAGGILLALGLWPLAVLAVVLVVAVSIYLGVQGLTVTPTRILISQGRGDTSPHTVELSAVVASEVVDLTWAQCFGLGLPDTVDTTRFTVRAGPTLSLTKRDGEQLRISAADPQAARAVLGR